MGPDGREGFVRKETCWMTSSAEIADVLRGDGRWKHEHRHVHLIGGRRAAAAAEYPVA